jgi:hypothetical protein
MHRVPRVMVLALLLLAHTLGAASAFASPSPRHSALVAPPTLWEPLARIWAWLSGHGAHHVLIGGAPTDQRAAPLGIQPSACPPNTQPQPNEGSAPDPNGA